MKQAIVDGFRGVGHSTFSKQPEKRRELKKHTCTNSKSLSHPADFDISSGYIPERFPHTSFR